MRPPVWIMPGWGHGCWGWPGLKEASSMDSWRHLWLQESIICTRKVSERSLGGTAGRWQWGPLGPSRLALPAAGISQAGTSEFKWFPGTAPKRGRVTAGLICLLSSTALPSAWGGLGRGDKPAKPSMPAEGAGGICLVLSGCSGVLCYGAPGVRCSRWAGGRWRDDGLARCWRRGPRLGLVSAFVVGGSC